MANISDPPWRFLPILGLSLVGASLGSFIPEIVDYQGVWAQEILPWPYALLDDVDGLLEQKGYAQALRHYQQVLGLSSSEPTLVKADILFQIGYLHDSQNEFEAALEAYQQSLQTIENLSFPESSARKAELWFQLGWTFRNLENFDQARASLLRSITLYRKQPQNDTPSRQRLGHALYTLGRINDSDGNLAKALGLYQEAYDIFLTLNDTSNRLRTATVLSGIHTDLGNYDQAYQSAKTALVISRTAQELDEEIDLLTLLGFIQGLRQRYDNAINYYEQALSLENKMAGNDTALILNNLGYTYLQVEDLAQARATLDQALTQVVRSDHPQAKAYHVNILDTFGDLYVAEQTYEPAWESYTLSLRLSHDIGDRIGQILTWINLADLLTQQKQPAVAIAFYKRAINDIEQIRANVRSLPLETQRRYTDTVADSYRELAALLLEQERVFEAQQVLDLLKIQELEDYFHDVRADQPTVSEKLPYLEPERTLLTQHRALLLQGPSDIETALSLADFLQNPDVARALDQLQEGATLKPDSLKQLQKDLKTLPHESAVLYPLILNDRLELLLIPKTGDPIHKTTWLAKHQLEEQVTRLRKNISDPSEDIRATAGSLHEAIIAPLQTELQKLKIDNIIYIPDGVLHYIPLSVLYNQADGQWLAETYSSYNLTTSEMSDLVNPPQRPFNALAAAFTDTEQTFEKFVDQTTTNFNGLFYADREVSFLKDKLPDTQILLNADFNRNNLETQLKEQNILHLATHAAFIPGQPENSFILLGDGDTITLKELRHLSLPSVDLVVLSACQTGISYIADGVEILGMGFQVQRTEARAALASLWWVDDRTTSQLMALFYDALTQGKTKAEALQNAQRQLIDQGQEEPYYWAPFVLIGNGL
ncbi:CHAT domain-containing protein [Leptothoe kymatousa]|uniref:CHAT domain-containing protein n=1 Tax=Leptothoe kymatousa TAU-MAC 1615 TaxID=2364775 RepID=A0ABS5Y2X1_9CYAN|nr:CHAT domain-containing protein [Leptothoe kymatousa]MBT9311971.1 CHAT domain-containing protein [Leptothoe kymatousa TAU-MAC 1615]